MLTQQTAAPEWTLKGRVEFAKCFDVYDGDTFKVIFSVDGDCYWHIACRAQGINTAEINSRDPVEKEKAIAARTQLRSLILGKIIVIKFGEFDKYGRPLADAFVRADGHPLNPEDDRSAAEYILSGELLNVNKFMIRSGMAAEYWGSGEKTW